MSVAPETLPQSAGIGVLRRLGWFMVVLVLGMASVAAWRWRAVFDPSTAVAVLAQHPAAPLIFLGLHIGASLLFVPRTLLAVGAGLVFGMWWGLVWAALGSVLGAVAGFLIARYVHAGLFARAGSARFAPALARVERGGWRMVAMIRLVPIIPHSLSNYALGLTRLRVASYALGSLIGQLPLTIAYVNLGTAGGRAMGGTDWLMPTAIGVTALAVSALVPALLRRRERAIASAG